jgi:hypothetical protein
MRVAYGGESEMGFWGREGDHQYQGMGGGLATADQARKTVRDIRVMIFLGGLVWFICYKWMNRNA